MATSGMLAVKEFFNMGTREFSTEWKKLSDADKDQLKAGVENGTLTY